MHLTLLSEGLRICRDIKKKRIAHLHPEGLCCRKDACLQTQWESSLQWRNTGNTVFNDRYSGTHSRSEDGVGALAAVRIANADWHCAGVNSRPNLNHERKSQSSRKIRFLLIEKDQYYTFLLNTHSHHMT